MHEEKDRERARIKVETGDGAVESRAARDEYVSRDLPGAICLRMDPASGRFEPTRIKSHRDDENE